MLDEFVERLPARERRLREELPQLAQALTLQGALRLTVETSE